MSKEKQVAPKYNLVSFRKNVFANEMLYSTVSPCIPLSTGIKD